MNIKLQNYLFDKYPSFFKDKNGEPIIYIECGNGWFHIIYWICEYLHSKIQVNNFSFLQIKEKFAFLRIYYRYDDNNKEIDHIIRFAEFMSGFFCEETGSNKNIVRTSEGWSKTTRKNLKFKKSSFYYVYDDQLRRILSEVEKEKS